MHGGDAKFVQNFGRKTQHMT